MSTDTTTTTLIATIGGDKIEWGLLTTTTVHAESSYIDSDYQHVLTADRPIDEDGELLDGNWATHDTRDAAESAARKILGVDVWFDEAGPGQQVFTAAMTLIVAR